MGDMDYSAGPCKGGKAVMGDVMRLESSMLDAGKRGYEGEQRYQRENVGKFDEGNGTRM